MTGPPLIDIRDATFFRGTTRVFHRFSLRVGQRESVAILGPNGSGKTTLLKAISREIYPRASDDSHVRILGRERWNVWDLRRHFGVVSHDLQAGFPHASTALEVVVSGFYSSMGVHSQLVREVSQEQIDRARQALETLGLGRLLDRPFGTLSTGQQRRCLLGRALVHDPDTLVLDEPTAGLDFAGTFDYLGRLGALARQGKGIVLATHHLNEIPAEVRRVVLLQEGRVAADGDKSSVLTSDLLSRVYATPIKLAEVEGRLLAYPGS